MLQNPDRFDEILFRITDSGFEICGVSQELPYLLESCQNHGFSLKKCFGGEYIFCKGFREFCVKSAALPVFSYDGYDFPGEHRIFFSVVIDPALKALITLMDYYRSDKPIDDLLLNVKISNTGNLSTDQENQLRDIQLRYFRTTLKILNSIKSEATVTQDLFFDVLAVLAQVYYVESFLMALLHWDENFLKNLPKSDLCPKCLGPGNELKDRRSSKLCKKCRNDIKIQKQRERRGTQLIGERLCACGCGEIITGRLNKKFVNDTHGRRVQKR